MKQIVVSKWDILYLHKINLINDKVSRKNLNSWRWQRCADNSENGIEKILEPGKYKITSQNILRYLRDIYKEDQ